MLMLERVTELARRVRRGAESRRRLVVLVVVALLLLLYAAPRPLLRLLAGGSGSATLSGGDASGPEQCLQDRLASWSRALSHLDAETAGPDTLAPYIGNGHFALLAEPDSRLYVRSGRTLALPLNFHPVISVEDYSADEATVVDYITGTVNKFQCSPRGYSAVYKYYAHRALPSLFVQDVKISNPTGLQVDLSLTPVRVSEWPSISKRIVELRSNKYEVYTGRVDHPRGDKYVMAVTIVTSVVPSNLNLKARDSVAFKSYTIIEYGEAVLEDKYDNERIVVEKSAIESLERAIEASDGLRESHADIWRQLWYTGFTISESKAANAINGDKINATVYAVLSQVRTLEREEGISPVQKSDILRSLTYTEGCYEGHYTLQAENLWKPLQNIRQINIVVRAWLLTLEKQGCHNLLRAGASGVLQAMVLSFGSLRFSNQHLEFNMHPSDLHRDFNFRRLNYGNLTHVNISVIVQEDNMAALYVALDRSDRSYFACDAGCLDSPMLLGPARKFFPVKLTDPITSILYITSDKQHMEDLRHAIHVKEVMVAPAHEHHVIALHKHGHSLGGLSTMFWVFICLVIVVFHMFLCRIIMSEYCDPPDKYRRLNSKP